MTLLESRRLSSAEADDAPTMKGLNGFGSSLGLLIPKTSSSAIGGADGVVLSGCNSAPSCFGGLVETETSSDGCPESTNMSLP